MAMLMVLFLTAMRYRFLDVTIATEATICLKIFFDVMVFHDFHQRSKDAMFASDCSSLIMLQ